VGLITSRRLLFFINWGTYMRKTLAAVLFSSCLMPVSTAFAAELDFNGNFVNDNDVVRIDFNVTTDDFVTLFSSSWINGGFDPILTLWDSAGNLILEQDDGGITGTQQVNGIDFGYGEFDSFLNIFLEAGSYIATLTQFDNFSASFQLSDGFLRADPFFTSAFGCSNGQFCEGSLVDSNGDFVEPNRTSAWEFHLLNVDSAQLNNVPEPSAMVLLGIAGMAIAAGRRGRLQTQTAAI
ncbi:MAG: hypothetical protein CTY34_11935, partial [Methylobacter sp.]